MTERERWRIEYEQAHRRAKAMLVLTMVVLVGVLLGYRSAPSTDVNGGYNVPGMAP